jgi:hypothetical protein
MDRTIVLDQGSRPGPPLTKGKVLVIDHHFSSQVCIPQLCIRIPVYN